MDPSIAIDITSDDEDDHSHVHSQVAPPTVLVIEDDPTPQKPNSKNPNRVTSSFIAETPLSDDVSLVKCSFTSDQDNYPSNKFAEIPSFICLESDNDSEDAVHNSNSTRPGSGLAGFELVGCSERNSTFASEFEEDMRKFNSPIKPTAANDGENSKAALNLTTESSNSGSGTVGSLRRLEDDPSNDNIDAELLPQVSFSNHEEYNMPPEVENAGKRKGKYTSQKNDRNNQMNDVAARKKQQKEEKARINEEKKRKRQEEKLEKEALKAEKAEKRKLEKETQNWEKGKFAVKSIVAVIDAKIVENGSIGGHLLTRFAEKGLSYRITSNPVEKSILWQMRMPDQIAQVSNVASDVPYVLIVYQAEEFCELVVNGTLNDQICSIQSRYPFFTICCLTNKLMSYINKCEQNHYKNPSKVGSWKRPPVEEALSTLSTHFTKVHSRQCFDEAELADHIVGLTSSLATCQFRKKLTHLSVNANGSIVPKDFIDRNVIKKNVWLKALVAIPKVQPRHAMAIWKRYPTMRSLLNVYMDPNISTHEKEFLLKDLKVEGVLGNEDRRLGEVCSKRIYRILMAQSGGIKTDEVEDGADLFV